MMTFDRRDIRIYLAVNRYGSIRAASDQLGLAPSVVSRQIAEMEAQLGVQLFERSSRGVRLTDAGNLVLEHARRVVEEFGFLNEQLADLRGIQQRDVRVHCGEGFLADFVQNGLSGIMVDGGNIRYDLQVGSTDAVVAALANGDTDIGIAFNPPVTGAVRTLASARHPLGVVMPPDHPLMTLDSIRLADCLAYPLAMLPKGHGTTDLLMKVAADSGLALAPRLMTTSIDALRRFVASGLGVAFLPRASVMDVAVVRELSDLAFADASAHLMVRARRRLPASVDRLARHLERSMATFAGRLLGPQHLVAEAAATLCAAAAKSCPDNRKECAMSQGQVVGVVGLGAMGLGMAASSVRAGYRTLGFDLAAARRDAAADAGVEAVASLAEVFAADRIVFSLPTAKDVESVVDAMATVLKTRDRVVIIDTSTSEPDVSRALAAKLAALGHGFLDAPVSGGPAAAAKGALTMMIGGTLADLADAQGVIDALSAKAIHVGDSGAGNVAKLVNNLLCAAHMVTTAEGLRLAEAAGIPAQSALNVLNAASGGSMLSEVHFPTWIMDQGFDSGFTMALMQKDVRLAQKLAADCGTDLPLTTEAARLWRDAPYAGTEDFTRMGDFRKKGH